MLFVFFLMAPSVWNKIIWQVNAAHPLQFLSLTLPYPLLPGPAQQADGAKATF